MRPSNAHLPLLQASIVFLFLFGLIVGLAYKYDFSQMPNLGGLLFLTAALSCMLVAKITYNESKQALQSAGVPDMNIDTELSLSTTTYVELFKNSPVPYLVIDGQGHAQSVNTAALRLFGVPKSKLVGTDVFARLHLEDSAHLAFLIEKYQNGISVSDELVAVARPDGQEAWALFSLFRFVNQYGEVSGLLTLVDITKQKRAEDAKTEFVSLASHQLRTPIAGMKWSAELLEMDDSTGGLSAPQKKYVDRLLVSINRMALLVDDFLRVSRFDLGAFRPEYQTVLLEQIFADIMTDTAARVAQKSLVVETQFDASLTAVVTDPNLIRMIVTNLYTNAIKYTPAGGTITLGFAKQNDAIAITVTDTGMGIPAADQDQIFTKLFRASNATRDVPDGTGLGLYIAREAVRVLGGQINFTSTERVGTSFEVLLPLSIPAV